MYMRYRQVKKILKGSYKLYAYGFCKVFKKTGKYPNGNPRHSSAKKRIKKSQYQKFYDACISDDLYSLIMSRS